ncbi:hypothetical protein [Acetobacterium malicum]|uniref:hypothetical protein n=1 Tax=Acetobacterium malicum TaxID=52692 RepID=UPI0012EC8101|nr:hypothetical protein [Acetobacterium dehalogenans]
MKKSTLSMISAMTILSLSFSTSVFAASDQTTTISTTTTTAVSNSIGVEYRGHIQNTGDYPWTTPGFKAPPNWVPKVKVCVWRASGLN